MQNFLCVKNVRKIFEGQFIPGYIAAKKTGRHCDAYVCMVSGKVEYVFESYTFTATPENFFYLAKGSVYGINILENSSFICIDFDFEDSESVRESALYPVASASVKKDFERIFHVWAQKDPWYLSDTMSSIYSLYSLSLRSKMKSYAKRSEKFSQILAYLLKNYSDPDFTVSDLAENSGMSEVHLRRIFSSSVGTSPVKYLNILRLDKAKTMLATSDYTLEEISSAVGIRDPYYFSRLFKKEIGMTPSAYREKKQSR